MTKARDLSKLLSTSNGKIAGENLDVSFENINDTGTEGTKVASGTTAERGTTAGQFRFNSTTGKFECRNTNGFVTLEVTPIVSSVNTSNITQAQIDANFDLVITGQNFSSGDVVKFIANDNTEYTSPIVTINSSTQITARITSNIDATKEPYKVQVLSSSGLTGSLISAFNIDGAPVWQTASGNIGSVEENTSANLSISATDAEGDTVSYTETGGTILTTNGFSLNSSTGAITGTAPTVSGSSTFTFDARATSGTNFTDRTFNIIVGDPPIGGTELTYSHGGVNYKLHKFTSNGNFVLQTSKAIDIFMIGGGGGGGHHSGGGGGSGGLVWLTNQILSSGNYSAVIGTGGTAALNTAGTNGTNSTFNSKIALGGGGGIAAGGSGSAGSGGSGGGGGRGLAAGTSIQNSTYGYGQGFDGAYTGANSGANNYAGYAGGGTGQAGQIRTGGDGSSTFVGDANTTTAFLLGALAGTDSSNNATTSSSSGTLYIGGGGGGSDQQNVSTYFYGGKGGGGRGNSGNNQPTAGIANTGSGGGGQSYAGNVSYNQTGGSGLVIVRYEV